MSQSSGAPDTGPKPDAGSSAGNEWSDSGVEPDAAAGGVTSTGGGVGGANAGASGAKPQGGEAGTPAEADAGVCASRFATSVESFTAGPGQKTGQSDLPQIVLGPPKGAGANNGSVDVASLGNGGTITLGFAPSVIVDGPGPDFIVFENPFNVKGDPTNPFAELATVEVSEDGVTFYAYPCTATAYPYGSCAGWHPVYANPDTNSIDPTDPTVAGGDAFDLADVGVSEARFVRITDRPDLASVFDLDAVSIVHAACP